MLYSLLANLHYVLSPDTALFSTKTYKMKNKIYNIQNGSKIHPEIVETEATPLLNTHKHDHSHCWVDTFTSILYDGFNGVHVAQYLVLCVVFSVCPSPNYGFWLILWYLW